MRALAEFVMRGRTQASGAAFLGSALPLFSWISASIVSLVILRKGSKEGSLVLLWAILPLAASYYLVGDSSALIALIGTAILAMILRSSISWELTLLAAVLLASMGSWIFQLSAVQIVTSIIDWYLDMVSQLESDLQVPTPEQARRAFLAYFAMGQAYLMVLLLILARWWQSKLFNPGAFGQEFRQLRMSPGVSQGLLLVNAGCVLFSDQFGMWLGLLTLPFVMSATGFLYWYFQWRGWSGKWFTYYYLAMVFFFMPMCVLLVALALVDSLMNLRKRIELKEG